MRIAGSAVLATHAVQRVERETRHLQGDVEAEAAALLEAHTTDGYLRYLVRAYGFIAPLERCLGDTPGLARYFDVRRLQKHVLIEHDLLTLGMKQLEIQSIPQCMWIPWFDAPWPALGWAYVIEHATLEHSNLFRHVATVLPGEAAFSATYLKAYASATHEMWQSFARGLELASADPHQLDLIVDGAQAAYRYFRRWRATLDGKALSGPHPTSEQAPLSREPEPRAPSPSNLEE